MPLTALVGRDRDVELACETLRRADVRLLTLAGAGGVGKTRLAIAVANALSGDFSGGVGFVSLASVRDPDLVESTLAEALGVRDHAGRSLAQSLQLALDTSEVLLVLDNFEQVAAAAPAIANLVATAPRLKVLVTSRERLRISGEREFVVAPLEVPRGAVRTDPAALAALAENPAIALFVERVGGAARFRAWCRRRRHRRGDLPPSGRLAAGIGAGGGPGQAAVALGPLDRLERVCRC